MEVVTEIATKKVLVVDDEPDMGPLITGMFRLKVKRGELTFVHAENGAAALQKLEEQSDIDLILTDINMPVMDGLTFLNQIKDKGLNQKAIVISAYNDLKNIRTAMNRGAFDFITKPIDPEDLKATIDKGINEMMLVEERIRIKKELEEERDAKEKFLLDQKERLEIQVTERTATIHNQKTLLEVRNKEILDSIHYAKRLQEAILPPLSAFHAIVPEGFVLYQSKDIVSGDFYWFGESDTKKIVVAADCTGHGVAGALMSMMGVSLLNQIIGAEKIDTPSKVLDMLDAALAKSMRKSGGNSHIGMDVAILAFNKDLSAVEYAGANRPLWIIRDGELITIGPDKSPIGGLSERKQSEFTNQHVNISKGDALYIFTDGFADQFGGPDGKKLMRKNFKDHLINNRQLTMKEQGNSLHEYFENWRGSLEQVDDILVIGIKI